MTIKEKIHAIRFGNVNIKNLSDEDIIEIMDCYIPEDVAKICQDEIDRRREKRLKDI